jgi:hypothetical protein
VFNVFKKSKKKTIFVTRQLNFLFKYFQSHTHTHTSSLQKEFVVFVLIIKRTSSESKQNLKREKKCLWVKIEIQKKKLVSVQFNSLYYYIHQNSTFIFTKKEKSCIPYTRDKVAVALFEYKDL